MGKKIYGLSGLLLFLVLLLAATSCSAETTIGDVQTKSETIKLDDAESVTVEIEMVAGDLDVSGGADELLEADFTYNVDELTPEVKYSAGELIISHAGTKENSATLFNVDGYRNEWDLHLNEDVPMAMGIDVNAGRSNLKLGTLNLTSLDMSGGAGNVTVDLTGAPSLTELDFDMGSSVLLMDLTGDWAQDLNAGISAGVGDLTLQLPGTVGVRVDVKGGIGVVNAKNLAKDGDSYTNDAYGESDVTLHFEIKAGVGKINLEGEPVPVAAVSETSLEAIADEEQTPIEEATMLDEEIAAQLQAVLEEAVASPNTNYPGVVLHVSSPELGSWAGAAGLGQIETSTPMRPHDKFRGGSLTKPFISVVILQLVEEGLLSLDDPMTDVLPESITSKFANSDQITVRMLLNHTGGLPDFMNLAGPEIFTNLEKIWEEEEFLDFAAAQEPWFAPGEGQGYSNTDYTLLGMIIEQASGQSWRAETLERIIEPLNLENTFLPEPDDVTIPGDHAHGYNDFGAGVMDVTEISTASVIGAAGGQSLVTNAEDLSRFVTALAAGELFQEAGTMEEMLTFVPWPDGNPLSSYLAGYGLGVNQATFGGGINGVGHSGDTPGGYHGFVYYLPAQGMTISGGVNTEDYEAGFLLIPRALEVLVPGYTAAAPEPVAAFTPPIIDAEGNEIPGSIAAIETVNLGGFEQTITLRGVNTTNPVLLFLHGGPGMPSSPWVTWNNFQSELEEHFVVVHWDQRGAGKSFSEALTPEDMHVEDLVNDTLALTDILRQRFEQDKIFLWGHSWGSGLGFETLRENAEPYHAYIASAVRPNWNSTQTMSYEWVLEQAQQQNDSEAIQALEALQPFNPTNLEHVGMKNHFLSLYRGQDFYTEGLGDEYFDYALSGQSPEYTAADVENTLAGQGFTRQTLLPEIIQSGYDLYTDFPVSPIPVYFLAGRHDYETPGELSEEYFNFLEAPAKNFTWFENSAHNVMYDEPDKTNQELIRIANEVLDESVTEGAVQTTITPALLADLEAYIEQNRESLNVPGAAVAIVQGGEIVYAEEFGVKELGDDDPVTADTVFSIGSTGKAMTSMMAASLVDDGIIAWDTPLVEIMPQFQLSDETATQQITLREAFAHTSGLPQLGPVLLFSGLSPEGWVEYLATVPLAGPPGELYAYHNEMNAVGAYAAAVAAGAEYGENLFPTYTDLMQERVFDPLGMSSATFSAQEAAASPNHATPHFMGLNATLAETGFDVTPTHYWDIDTLAPAGTVRMNAPDVARFLITMLSGGVAPDESRVISTENLAETWTQQIAREPDPFLEKNGSGLGWSTVTYQGIPLVSKDGNIGGFGAQMAFIPRTDTGIVVLANADMLGNMLGRNVQYRLIEMLFGLEPLIDQVTTAELEGIGGISAAYSQLAAVDPELVAPFLGSYDMEGTPYTVELRDSRLWVSMGELDFIELLAAPDGSYMAVSGGGDFLLAPFQFVEGDDGQITMVIFGQVELPKLD